MAFTEQANAPQFWLRGEYLGWTLKDNHLPVTLATFASLSDQIPGAIGQPGTKILLGNKTVDMGWQNGFQWVLGTAINEKLSLEGSYFLFAQAKKKKVLNTTGEPGSPNLAVPIFDVTGFWGLNGVPGETIFILPGPLFEEPGFKGHFKLKLSSSFQGADLSSYIRLRCFDCFNLEGLVGFRWLQLRETLVFGARTGTVPDFSFLPGFYNFKDHFETTNNFFGGQLGLRAHYKKCNWFLESHAKIGMGLLNERIHIQGISETLGGNLFFITRGPPRTFTGGVFAQPTNIGKHTKNTFAAIFEGNLRGGYKISDCFEIYLGYNFLLIDHVARPGDQINRKINPTLTGLATASRETAGTGVGPIPFGESGPAEAPIGPKEPHFHFKTRLFWAQGLTAGLAIRF